MHTIAMDVPVKNRRVQSILFCTRFLYPDQSSNSSIQPQEKEKKRKEKRIKGQDKKPETGKIVTVIDHMCVLSI